jgi:hypothetical protein
MSKDSRMKAPFLIASAILVTGCSSNIYPSYHAGKYYLMGGDDRCQYVQQVSDTRIMCLDEDRNETGYRDALTGDELNHYLAQQQIYQAQMASLSQSIEQMNQSLNSYQPVYPAIQVQQPTLSNGWNGTNYRQVGSTVLGTDGSSYRRVGNTVIASDGTVCQMVGANILCK